MSIKKSSLGLLGLGYWGKNLARNLYDLGVLKAICDSNVETLKKYKKIYKNVSFYRKIDDFLKSKIVAVVIATPAKTHADLVVKSLNHEKHVFVEKPLCLDVRAGKKLIKIADKKGLKLMVGHLLLYHPAFMALKEEIKKGSIGGIRYLYSNRLSLGKLRKEENALWSFAPHDISMILSLVGSEPINVRSFGGFYLSDKIADTSITSMSFINGIKAHVFVSWLHPYKEQRLVVIGEKAMITFIDTEDKEKKLTIYRHQVSWNGNIPLLKKVGGRSIEYDYRNEPLKIECESFLNWIENDIKPPSDSREGLSVLKVLQKSENDLKRGLENEK